jgi:hypothetical protein
VSGPKEGNILMRVILFNSGREMVGARDGAVRLHMGF